MILHRIFSFLLLCGLFSVPLSPLSAQEKVINDLGLMGGGSWYFGDLNPSIMFYAPSPAVGIFFRPNFNKRYAVRTSLNYGSLRAGGAPNGDPVDLNFAAPFQHSFVDMSAQFEFNFLPYTSNARKTIYSPYVSAGIGYSFVFGADPAGRFVLPFGIGFKVNFTERIDGGVEWNFRKTFNDALDGYQNMINPDDKSFLHNNDWYSIVGIFVSFKIFYDREKCAAYW